MDKKTFIIFLFLPCLLFGQTVNIDSSSIGTASRDFSTIQGWEDAKDGNLVTQDTTRKGVCYNDASFDEVVTIDGSTTSDSTYMWLTVVAADRHDGTAGSGAKIERSVSATIMKVNDSFTVVEWLELFNTVGASTTIMTIENANNTTTRQLIVHKTGVGSFTVGISLVSSSQTYNLYNNILYDLSDFGIKDASSSGVFANLFNNTIYNTDEGIKMHATAARAIAKNNISMGAAVSDFSGSYDAASRNNMSSDATGDDPGATGALINKTDTNQFTSLTSGSEDFHLKSGADAIDAGTDLSGTFINDIDGVTRSGTWDMGADEFVAAPAGGTPATPKKARPRFWGLFHNNQNSPSTFWTAGATEQLLKRRFLL